MPIHLGCQPTQLGSRIRQLVRHRTRGAAISRRSSASANGAYGTSASAVELPDEHRDIVVGQRCGDLGGQACLAGPGLAADEHRLAVAALDPLPRLLERREFRGAAHQRAAAACDQFGWKGWWHPLRHAHNVAAQTPAGE